MRINNKHYHSSKTSEMKKLQLLLVALIALSLPKGFSQESDVQVSFGELSKIKASTELPITQVWPRGEENGLMYAYIPPFYEGKAAFAPPKKFRKRYMATISEDLQVTNYKEIVLPEDNYFQEVQLFNGTLYVFSRTSNKDMSASTLSVSTLNKASLELKNDMKALFEIKANTSDENNNLFFTFRTSPDGSKLLVTFQQVDLKQNILQTGLAVYDAELNQIWSQQALNLNIGNGVYLFNDFKVDNTGSVFSNVDVFNSGVDFEDARKLRYGLGRQLGFQSKYLKQSPQYTSYIVSYTNKGKTTSTHKLTVDSKMVRYVAFEPNGNRLQCVGLFSENNKTSIIGASYFEIVPEKTGLLHTKIINYDLAYILEGCDEKEAAKTKELFAANQEFENGLYELRIKFREDGGFWFLAEHKDISKEKMMAGPQGTLWLDCYQYKDIRVLNFESSGELLWKKKVDKLTFTKFEDAMYGSFGAHVKNDKLFLFYNMIEQKNGAIWKYKKSSFMAISFNKDGESVTNTISTLAEQEVVAQPYNIGHFSEDKVFFSGQETLKNRFFKVTVE